VSSVIFIRGAHCVGATEHTRDLATRRKWSRRLAAQASVLRSVRGVCASMASDLRRVAVGGPPHIDHAAAALAEARAVMV